MTHDQYVDLLSQHREWVKDGMPVFHTPHRSLTLSTLRHRLRRRQIRQNLHAVQAAWSAPVRPDRRLHGVHPITARLSMVVETVAAVR